MGMLFLCYIEEVVGICCNGGLGNDVMQFSGFFGIIFSFDYFYLYLSDIKCIWVVFVLVGKRVKLMFKDFDFGIGFI